MVQTQSDVEPHLAQRLRGVELLEGDLRDEASLQRVLDTCDPDEVYNLAGISSVAQSWRDPEVTADVNGLGTLRLIRALLDQGRRVGRTARLLQASSAEMFGSPETSPQDESTPLRPRNPYGVSKAFAHDTVATYRAADFMFASTVILYNHESTLRPPSFVTRKVTRGVAAIALGRAADLTLGDLDVERDWGYAGDYVQAMWLALQHEAADDFVIASGVSHSVRDLVGAAFAAAGIRDWEHLVRKSDEFVRPTDSPRLVGDAGKARSRLGWVPSLDFQALVGLMVRHDLEDLSADGGS